MIKTVTDMKGRHYRVDQVLTTEQAAKAQVYPGHTTLYLTRVEGRGSHHMGLTIPRWLAMEWVGGRIRVAVSLPEDIE